ncbi:hypothetical protein FZEAL_9186, partial [Fusarium zealandicum]
DEDEDEDKEEVVQEEAKMLALVEVWKDEGVRPQDKLEKATGSRLRGWLWIWQAEKVQQ